MAESVAAMVAMPVRPGTAPLPLQAP